MASLSLGLFLKLPSLLSSESIFSQSLNETILTFLSCRSWRSPSLPGFGKADVGINPPFSRSSDMLETYHVNMSNTYISNLLNKYKTFYYNWFHYHLATCQLNWYGNGNNMYMIDKQEIHTVSSAQYRFVAIIPVGPLFSQPHTYKPFSGTRGSEGSLNTRPLSFGTIPER